MTALLAIDPGNPGWHKERGASGYAIFDLAVLTKAGHGPPTRLPGVTEMAVEVPVVRRMGKSKGRPDDLIQLAIVVGRWIGCQPHVNSGSVTEYKPEAWKGQLPKDVCHARARAVLTASELACLPDLPRTRGRLDMWDAVSLGLVYLGRLEMRG